MGEVMVAFSGGVESTYCVQRYAELGHKVLPVFVCASGVSPNRYEVTLATVQCHKLKKLFPRNVWDLQFNLNSFFRTPFVNASNYQTNWMNVNQSFRIICAMMDMQSLYPNHVPIVGWTRFDTQEQTMDFSAYTDKQVKGMMELPTTLAPYSRNCTLPVNFQSPVWQLTKREVYSKLKPELLDSLVLNFDTQAFVKSHKIKEYVGSGLSIPSYIDEESRRIKNPDECLNETGMFFNSRSEWTSYFIKTCEIAAPDKQKFLANFMELIKLPMHLTNNDSAIMREEDMNVKTQGFIRKMTTLIINNYEVI